MTVECVQWQTMLTNIS